ncbi:hypothetical protein [Devosia beringensis]|uniref:hypothetical protein n=1 Tax=Devosia beringensis TaxID=2657486 RepID=UPI00186B9707|nr:hypothetical protein [Devosia beringensis]
MAIIQKVSGYDAILAQRARRADAAAIAEARSQARREAAQNTMAKSDGLRSTLATTIANTGADQSQLTSQLIRTRMAEEAKAKAQPSKWYI